MQQLTSKVNYFERLYSYIRAVFGSPEYQYKVAQMISNSELPNAKEGALRWYKIASENRHTQACFDLAVYTINNTKDEDAAISILRKAHFKENAEVEALLGQLLLSKYTNVLDQRRFEAEHKIKNAKGQDELDRYIESLMPSQTKPNRYVDTSISDEILQSYLEEAKKHLTAAQELDHPLGYHALAIYYLQYAPDSRISQSIGIKLLQNAVSKGFAPSCQVMAGIYENGLYGQPVNITRGLELRVVAAEQGSKDAQFTLGYLVYNGQGFEANRDLGLHLIKKSAQNGHIEAINFLAALQKENAE